jgi:hypothetical protein
VGWIYDDDDIAFDIFCCTGGKNVYRDAIIAMAKYSSLVFRGIMDSQTNLLVCVSPVSETWWSIYAVLDMLSNVMASMEH